MLAANITETEASMSEKQMSKKGAEIGWMAFNEGKRLVSERKFEEAVDQFSQCLETLYLPPLLRRLVLTDLVFLFLDKYPRSWAQYTLSMVVLYIRSAWPSKTLF